MIVLYTYQYAARQGTHEGRLPGSVAGSGQLSFDSDFEIAGTIRSRIEGVILMSKGQSLQEPFLNALRKEHVPVSIYLVNGIKLQGQIESFDQFVVLLKNSVSQMVYKHAISTVVPARNVKLPRTDDGGGEE